MCQGAYGTKESVGDDQAPKPPLLKFFQAAVSQQFPLPGDVINLKPPLHVLVIQKLSKMRAQNLEAKGNGMGTTFSVEVKMWLGWQLWLIEEQDSALRVPRSPQRRDAQAIGHGSAPLSGSFGES